MSESEGIPHIDRIRCRHCGRRVRADATVCPNCGHDPRSFAFPPVVTLLILFALGVALALLLWYNARLVFLAFDKQATLVAAPPTATETWTPRVRVFVATETPNPAPTETSTPAAPPSPTFTPLPTLTATSTIARSAPRATNTATLTPTPSLQPAPDVYTPDDGAKFYGPSKQIVFGWTVPNNLPTNNWYRVRVEFSTRDNVLFTWCGWTQQGQIQFLRAYYDDSSPNDRSFHWSVQLFAAANAPNDQGCDFAATPLSAPGAPRTFFWY